MKDKIIETVNKAWFKAAIAGGIATLLLIDGDIFYAGIGYGYAIREHLRNNNLSQKILRTSIKQKKG